MKSTEDLPFDITWHGDAIPSTKPSDPKYPEGIHPDLSRGVDKACVIPLPYPAPGCGRWQAICKTCSYSVAVTAAGRADDPRSVKVPCKSAGAGLAHQPLSKLPRQVKVQQASAKMEAFYAEALTAIAKIAREKYGDEPKVLHMLAAFGKACGMFVCACHPNERDLARETAIVNMDDAIKKYAQGDAPSPMGWVQ